MQGAKFSWVLENSKKLNIKLVPITWVVNSVTNNRLEDELQYCLLTALRKPGSRSDLISSFSESELFEGCTFAHGEEINQEDIERHGGVVVDLDKVDVCGDVYIIEDHISGRTVHLMEAVAEGGRFRRRTRRRPDGVPPTMDSQTSST